MSEWTRANTDWFRDAKWGVFVHYLGKVGTPADEWNRDVDSFDVDALARQLAEVGAGYFFITVGQTSGHWCAPNATYDEYAGIVPSKCSKRDLLLDLYDALEKYDIPLMAYIPADPGRDDKEANARMRWQDPNKMKEGDDKRQAALQQRYEAVIREWSGRWGKRVRGWWVDGCVHADEMYRYPDAPNFRSFAEAMKAGNPDAIVAFNPGIKVPVICHTEYEDYTAGELSGDLPVGCWGHFDAPQHCTFGPLRRWVEGAQFHVLNFLGPWWCASPPRFPDAMVAGYTQFINSTEGVVSWDVPTSRTGRIPDEFMRQLAAIRDVTRV